MESQYTDSYLHMTAGGRLLTPGTYLAYVLRGRARKYAGRYQSALMRSLEKRGARPVKSVRGGIAYTTA